MPVEIGWIEPTRTLRLAGELDVLSAPEVTSFLEGQEQGDGDLVFDLSGLSFVDSSGVRALIRAADSLAGRGRLVLRSPTSTVWRVFDLMGLIGTSPHLVVEGSGWQPRPDEETRSYPAETSALVEVRRFIRTRALADAYGEWA